MQTMNPVHYVQRFELVNLAQGFVVSQFSTLLAPAYMTDTMIASDTTGITGSGTFTFSTLRLALTTRSTDFNPSDVGKTVGFRVGTAYYSAVIGSWVSVSTVTITGSLLPSSDQTVDEAMVLPSLPTGDFVDLSILNPPMMRTGEQVKITLESSLTRDVAELTRAEVTMWQAANPMQLSAIGYCIEGSKAFLVRGSALTTYGTLLLHYPRVPIQVFDDTDYVDMPDGPVVNLGLIYLRRMMTPPVDVNRYSQEIQENVRALLGSFGGKLSTEEIAQKVKAFT
jgi:hypothetical protein